MSLLHNEEYYCSPSACGMGHGWRLLTTNSFAVWHLRSSYLSAIKDGVGDRLINVNPSVLNSPGFRAAGWSSGTNANAGSVRRSNSPPIPTATAVASEYFRAARDEENEGGSQDGETRLMNGVESLGVQLGNDSNAKDAPPLRNNRRVGAKKSRRKKNVPDGPGNRPHSSQQRREDEDDSSDLSDDSDEDAEGGERCGCLLAFLSLLLLTVSRGADDIKFAKMPVGSRAGSPPVGTRAQADGPQLLVTSPSLRSSMGLKSEQAKTRSRGNTTTSSDLSSDNDIGRSVESRRIRFAPKTRLADTVEEDVSEKLDDENDASPESPDSVLSSDLEGTTESGSLLGSGISNPLAASSPLATGFSAKGNASPRKRKDSSAPDLTLPPPRPINMVQPASLLSAALKSRKKQPANPVEKYAQFSGEGSAEPPLYIKIFFPTSSNPAKGYEIPLVRDIKTTETRPVTVSETIGLSLWTYTKAGLQPPLEKGDLSPNKWCLRMIDEGEVDYDIPALGADRPMIDFTSNNNRSATARGRMRSKPFDEFGLVRARETEQKRNQELCPQADADEMNEETGSSPAGAQREGGSGRATPNQGAGAAPKAGKPMPMMGQPFPSALNDLSLTPADLPTVQTMQATPRLGVIKTLKIYFANLESSSQLTTMNTSTDSYLAEVLDSVCKKWGLEKGNYLFKVAGSHTIAPLDRTVEALGPITDLELVRRRFGTAPLSLTGSPTSSSPNAPLTVDTGPSAGGGGYLLHHHHHHHRRKKQQAAAEAAATIAGGAGGNDVMGGTSGLPRALHPLAQNDVVGYGYYRRYPVWRKQSMSFTASNARVLVFDSDYMHILPPDKERPGDEGGGNGVGGGGGGGGGGTLGVLGGYGYGLGNSSSNHSSKARSVSYSDVVGSKVNRRHPKSFRVVVLRGIDAGEQKRYDFEARSVEEAAEIVDEIKRNMMHYRV